jgi:hypothetical protein
MRPVRALLFTALLLPLAATATESYGDVVLVEAGEPRAVIVTADAPSRMAAYAVEELVSHVKKASGATLSVAKESAVPEGFAHRVYVGDTQAARRLGIKPEELPFDESVLRSAGNDLYIVGREIPLEFWAGGSQEGADPLSGAGRDPKTGQPFPSGSGTLFGVYELLERYLGVRWVWPGELGAYVPRAATLRVPAIDLSTRPKLALRSFIWDSTGKLGTPQPGSFSGEPAWSAFRDAQRVYERRHRQGLSKPIVKPWHFFEWWWTYFGGEHPEWFMMDANGKRGEWGEQQKAARDAMPKKEHSYGGNRPLCVSNPDLPRFIVENDWDAIWAKGIPGPWYSGYFKQWFGKTFIDLSECDNILPCECPECKAMDVAAPPHYDVSDYWGRPNTSDRYAAFWKRVYDLAVQRNPDIKITTHMYWQTFPAPLGEVKLNKNIIGEFCPWTGRMMWMPMPEKSYENMKQQWLGWKRTGMTMRLRPNFPHGNNILPFTSIRQAGEFIRFTAREGSQGCVYDGLYGHYGVQGLGLYVQMRLMADPDLEVDAVRAEFCSAFGPAASAVDRYFRSWEEYSEKIVSDGERYPQWGPRNYYLAARLYTPEKIAEAKAILDEGLAAARTSPEPEFAARVEFLEAGLEHARLFAALLNALEWDGKILRPSATDKARFEAAKKAYADLLAFRLAHEHLPISDLRHAAGLESDGRGWLALSDLGKTFDEIRQAAPRPAPNPWSQWRFRKDPEDAGVKAEWFKPDADLKDWTSIKVPEFWDTSLGEIIGYGWYHTTFVMPKEWKGERLTLEFGGVDEQAWVYVNGVPVGEHTVKSTGKDVGVLWDKPFTIEVKPELLRSGEENTLVVRVHNTARAGGIHRPVIGHAPHPEKWRPLPGREMLK